MPKVVSYASESEWLKLRMEDVTSTESAALFSLSPFLTEFELWHYKRRKTSATIDPENTRIKWGKRLQDVIAEGVAEDLNINVRRLDEYMRHATVEGMGSSFDYLITDGPKLMEIKNVDGLVFRNEWDDNEAPAHIEVQVQHQMEVADIDTCLIVALVGGNQPHIIERKRDREVGKALCKAVEKFWQSVHENKPPEPNLDRDADFIISLHQSAGGAVVEATEDLQSLLGKYAENKRMQKLYENDCKRIKAQFLEAIGDDVSKVTADGITLHCGMSKETPPTVITEDMVGQTYGGRKSYRTFRVTEKKND